MKDFIGFTPFKKEKRTYIRSDYYLLPSVFVHKVNDWKLPYQSTIV